MATTRREWALAFLPSFTGAITEPKVVAILAWQAFEFGTLQPIPFAWNPLASTEDTSGATSGNSVGVKCYPDMQSGLNAIVANLREDHGGYQTIRDTLANSDDAQVICAAISASEWGSHPSPELVALVEADPAAYGELYVDSPAPGHQSGEPGNQNPGDDMTDDQATQLSDVHNAIFDPTEGLQKVVTQDISKALDEIKAKLGV